MNERTSRLRVILVRKLKRQCGKSWATLAKECRVHPGTMKRWLAGGEVYIDNISALAKALGTTADKIMLPNGEEDLIEYVDADMTVEGNLADLKQPQDITAIIEAAQKAIGAKYKILLMYVGDGSIRIAIKLHTTDAIQLLDCFNQGKLQNMGIISVSIDFAKEIKRRTAIMLQELPRLQQEIIKLHFGLPDGYTYSYDEIARILKMSVKKVRAQERLALDHIRMQSKETADILRYLN